MEKPFSIDKIEKTSFVEFFVHFSIASPLATCFLIDGRDTMLYSQEKEKDMGYGMNGEQIRRMITILYSIVYLLLARLYCLYFLICSILFLCAIAILWLYLLLSLLLNGMIPQVLILILFLFF